MSTNVVSVTPEFSATVNDLFKKASGTTQPEQSATVVESQQVLSAFEHRALPLIARSVPVIPLRPQTKIAFVPAWQNAATLSAAKVREWAQQDPDCNVGAVAKAQQGGVFFLEIDRPNFHQVIQEQTGQKLPTTFAVSSRKGEGRGHFYLRHTPASIALGSAKDVYSGKDENGKEAWSARLHNAYCVGPLSIHPDTGKPYEVLVDAPIADAPDWLVQWIQSQAEIKKTGHAELDSEEPIVEGSRNDTLASLGGRARQVLKMDKEELFQYLLSQNQKRCNPPLPESEVRTIANSIGRYDVKPSGPETVILGGKTHLETQAAPVQIEVPKLNKVPYPVFPSWVMKGTSIYDHFVEPVCAKNSRIPYFMFLPAAALMMNYLALKVSVQDKRLIPSIFMVLIGEKGRAIKSSSVEDAIEYMEAAGVLKSGQGVRNAEGKTLIWTAGSGEGLGLEMARTNCKNTTLFYDELSTLTSKSGIDSSTLRSHILTLYESGRFSNTIKRAKETFNFDQRTYCASLIACTTNEIFEDEWSKLTGKSTGLDDRFTFLLQPEKLADLTPPIMVNTVVGAAETKKRIDKAEQQVVYKIDDSLALEAAIGELGNRTEIRAEKWALYFAVDLGRDTIDNECVERALAIARYERAVKKYLGSPEAETKVAAAQLKYRRILERQFDGRATERQMERAMNYSRYGTDGWWRIFDGGLVRAGIVGKVVADGQPSVYTIKPLEE
jgi:hypothetical protein